ncbi:hypothetical protein RhiirA1_479836 [Rhizophagus irregularis]|uniref:Uncharacterized protein n=1 Tax=Rhizophagus irregularis TaxID=588596 RepID=A0A2N0QQ48_9GLOM|nr:hypothetical protein RhiirA1_479836 [Rhizophagus irregularis]
MQSTSDFQQQQQEKISKIRRPGIVTNFINKVVKPATYTSTFATKEISKIHRGVVTNFIYKVVELATYTSTFVTDAINILTRNTLNTGDVSTWGENVETVEDEELPPPYDNFSSTTTTTTNTTTTETKPSLIISTSSTCQMTKNRQKKMAQIA